jgi:esterase/lipase superfamily enzyme
VFSSNIISSIFIICCKTCSDLTEDEVSELLCLVAHVHHTYVTADALEALLAYVDDQRRTTDGVVTAAHDVDLDARLGRGVESVPVADDQRVLHVFGDLVEHELGAQTEEEVLRLLDDLLQECLAGNTMSRVLKIV